MESPFLSHFAIVVNLQQANTANDTAVYYCVAVLLGCIMDLRVYLFIPTSLKPKGVYKKIGANVPCGRRNQFGNLHLKGQSLFECSAALSRQLLKYIICLALCGFL